MARAAPGGVGDRDTGHDLLDVPGTADLQGGTVQITLLTDAAGGTSIILTARCGVTGARLR